MKAKQPNVSADPALLWRSFSTIQSGFFFDFGAIYFVLINLFLFALLMLALQVHFVCF